MQRNHIKSLIGLIIGLFVLVSILDAQTLAAEYDRVLPEDAIVPEALLTPIQLVKKELSLVEALELLADRSGVTFNYIRDRIPADSLVRFDSTNAPAIEHLVKIMAASHTQLVITPNQDLIIQHNGDTGEAVVYSQPISFELEEVIVSPGAFAFMGSVGALQQTMNRTDIESVPKMGEDIFRAVNRLPGLSSGDYTAHFSVRGGRHDETLVLLDGLEVYEPYHLKDLYDGATSIIDIETIESVNLMTGGFPAQYGNKTSGVFELKSRSPAIQKPRYGFGLSLMNAFVQSEGSYDEGKGSWFVTARRGYVDLLFSIVGINDQPSPFYYDVFAKTIHQIHPKHTLALNLLHAEDHWFLETEETTGYQDTSLTDEYADNSYGNTYLWLTLNSTLSKRVSLTTIPSVGLLSNDRFGYERYQWNKEDIYRVRSNREFGFAGLKQELRFAPSKLYSFKTGYDFRQLDATYSTNRSVGKNPEDPTPDPNQLYPITHTAQLDAKGYTFGAYASNRIRLLKRWTTEVGARFDHGSYTGDNDVSPRISSMLRVTDDTSLRLAWGQYRQMQGIQEIDLLNGATEYYHSELSVQWTGGVEHSFPSGATVRLEGYYKEGSHLRPVFRNWNGGTDVFPETNEDRIRVYPERSLTRGIELYFGHDLHRKLSMKGSYALSWMEEDVHWIENVNDPGELVYDRNHYLPQDQRHTLNVDGSYRADRNWTINFSYAFHSGWPVTTASLVEVIDEDGEPDAAVKPDKIYGNYLPDYHRIDVRATRRYYRKNSEFRIFFEILNLTNNENTFAYDFVKVPKAGGGYELLVEPETWFSITPSLGFSWRGNLNIF